MNIGGDYSKESRVVSRNIPNNKLKSENIVVSVLSDLKISGKRDLFIKMDQILKTLESKHISVKTVGEEEFKIHLVAAIHLYAKNNEKCRDIHLSDKDIGKIMDREKLLLVEKGDYYVIKVSENEVYGISQSKLEKIKGKSVFDRTPDEQNILALMQDPQVEIVKYSEVARLKQNYDKLATAQQNIEARSAEIHNLMTLKSQDVVKVEHLIVGAGFAGEQLWRTKFKEQHQEVDKSLNAGELPSSLMITGKGEFGNWRKGIDYTFAQPHAFLEQPGRTNPSDFTTEATYEHNKYVVSRHLNQANRVNLDENQAPVCLGTECTKIECRPQNPGTDWKVPSSQVRAQLQMVVKEEETVKHHKVVEPAYHDGKTFVRYLEKIDPRTGLQEVRDGKPVYLKQELLNKTVYANSVDVCSGLGRPQSLLYYYKSALDEATYDRLSQYNPQKQITPIMDSNTAILTNRLRNELKNGPKTHTLVIGTGGNSAATAAELLKYKQTMTWLVRDNLNLAGHGSYVHGLIGKSAAQDAFAAGSILKIEEKGDKLEVLIKMNAAQDIEYYDEKIPQSRTLPNREVFDQAKLGGNVHDLVEVIRLPVDRIVFALGQNDEATARMLEGIPLEAHEVPSPAKGMPDVVVGLKSKDNAINIWGGAAVGAGVTKDVKTSTKKTVVDAIREHMKEERVSDNTGVGAMNPTVEHMKRAAGKSADLSSINVNATSRDVMVEFFKSAGIDEAAAHLLAKDIWEARQRTPQKNRAEVLLQRELKQILAKYGSMNVPDKVKISGHYHLVKAS